MDLFDERALFGRYVPQIAATSDIVLSAALTYAAKRLAKIGLYPYDKVVQICDESVRRIASSLMTGSDAVLAAITILSGSELFEAHGQEWSSHLGGLHALVTELRLNGSSGGLRQSAFWIYAREDTLAALMTNSRLKLDPLLWSVSPRRAQRDDEKGNESVYLLARVVNYLADEEKVPHALPLLLSELDGWRQRAFWPLVNSEKDGLPWIYYLTTLQASAMQMFHLANFLLQNDADTHASQIIGISNAGMKDGGRVQSVQALYYVGLHVTDARERRFVLSELRAIEAELGWGTRYRTDSLIGFWHGEP